MKLRTKLSVIGLSLKVNEGKEGNKFYQISVDQDGEAGTLPMTEEAYLNIEKTFNKYYPTELTCEFNDQYKSMRVVGATQAARGVSKV